jgi:hypothetical protein
LSIFIIIEVPERGSPETTIIASFIALIMIPLLCIRFCFPVTFLDDVVTRNHALTV